MKFSGSLCALATPFSAGGALDLAAFARLIEHQIAGGTEGLVVAGSTGEAHALEPDEFDRLVAFAVETVAGRMPVIAGTGGANTRKTVRATQRAEALGADGALVVTPYYVKPTQAGLIEHYRAVAGESGLPIVLYNVPGRTGCDLLPETAAILAAEPGIVGIKEARAEPERMGALLPLRSERFAVLSGDDPTATRSLLAGADGVISVANNVAPSLFRSLCDYARVGEVAAALALERRLQPLFDAIAVESNPIPVKWCLAVLGIGEPRLRLPLTTLGAAHRERLRTVIEDLQGIAA